MLGSDLPEEFRDMRRGLLIAVLGVDMDERPAAPTGDLLSMCAAIARVEAERSTS